MAGTRYCVFIFTELIYKNEQHSAWRSCMTQQEKVNWQDAVALLAKERTIAMESIKLIKKHGNIDAVERGRVAYGDAKSEYDGIIAGLIVAIASKQNPSSLSNLKDRLTNAIEKREAFCRLAEEFHTSITGQKDLSGIIIATIGQLFQAIQSIYSKVMESDDLTRRTIQTQLESISWPEYDSVKATL